ncbi:FkbM family methyltransferase [Spirosoma rigui]|uniref:FkbM family methyltransferase n=1 Tax=Spirosoma rigui TaxID=564064 RepID=UPI0009B0716F|nr:FkbM family methyltransferase [Spirosoma rigui]
MNIYNKIRRFVSKQLRILSTQIEPIKVTDEFSVINAYGFELSQDISFVKVTVDGHPVTLRKRSSDALVFEQIFINKEYFELIDIIQLNEIPVSTIVDLGANIGLSAVFLHTYFPEASFVCVEPDKENFDILKVNLLGISNIVTYQKAVWSEQKNIYLNRNFRDGKDWSISSSENNSGAYSQVDTITINNILQDNNLNGIDLLKIDVEGAESELFKNLGQVNFLEKTKVIAIEIHDEFNVRDDILSVLVNHDFILIESKQTLIAVNFNYIRNNRIVNQPLLGNSTV